MDNKIKGAGWWNTVTALMALVFGVLALMASRTGMLPAPVTCFVLALLVIGFLVALVSSFHLHLLDREQQEQLEHEELNKGSADSSMFESDAFAARRTREQFDRWLVPGFTVLLMLLEGGGAWWLAAENARFYDFSKTQALEGAGVVVAIASVFGLFLFLRGRYATVLAREVNANILQPGSDFLLLNAYLFFLLAGVSAAALQGYPLAHQYLAVGLCAFMAILALETLLRLILEIYRPRMKGQEVRQLYHSRLVGLISKPEGFFTTAAHALDYQFGFRVSETWGYRFLRERLGMLVMLQVFVLWLSTSVVIIPQGQVGHLERNGEKQAAVLQPGIRFKLPWPFDQLKRHYEDEVRLLYIGPELSEERLQGLSVYWYDDKNRALVSPKQAGLIMPGSRTWMEPDVQGFSRDTIKDDLYKSYFVTKGEEDIGEAVLAGGVFVQYRVSNIGDYASRTVNPEIVLEKLVTRELTRQFLENNSWTILTQGKGKLARDIRAGAQKQADEAGLGLKILSVGLSSLQPPPVAPNVISTDESSGGQTTEKGLIPAESFEGYFVEKLNKRSREALAHLEASSRVRVAEIDAEKTVAQGGIESVEILSKAQVDNQREQEFARMLEVSPRVFREFQWVEAQSKYLGSVENKIVLIGVDAETYEVDPKQGAGGLLGGRVPVDTKQEF
ncbi:MAG: hypothetical protein CMO66_01550 [Verrucomicrobiales bacterium]|nr:hypothetical protein [Verrucomicrobiales bacterium]